MVRPSSDGLIRNEAIELGWPGFDFLRIPVDRDRLAVQAIPLHRLDDDGVFSVAVRPAMDRGSKAGVVGSRIVNCQRRPRRVNTISSILMAGRSASCSAEKIVGNFQRSRNCALRLSLYRRTKRLCIPPTEIEGCLQRCVIGVVPHADRDRARWLHIGVPGDRR